MNPETKALVGHAVTLQDQIERGGIRLGTLLPTPKTSDPTAEKSVSGRRSRERSTALGTQINLLATPRTADANGPAPHGTGAPNRTSSWIRGTASPRAGSCRPRASDVKGFNQRRNQENLVGAALLGMRGESGGRVDWGRFEPAIRRWERILGRPAPAP